MDNQLSRRAVMKGVALSATSVALGAEAGCGAVAPTIGSGLLQTVIGSAATAFGMKIGQDLADSAPKIYNDALRAAQAVAGSLPTLGAYVVGDIPDNQLRALVAAILPNKINGEAPVEARAVHASKGHGLELLPAMMQLGISALVLRLSGYSGNYLEPDANFHSDKLAANRSSNTVYFYRLTPGGSENVAEGGRYRAKANDDSSIEVEWAPSPTDPSTDGRLTIRKGQAVQDRPPNWRLEFDVAVPFRYIFSAPSVG